MLTPPTAARPAQTLSERLAADVAKIRGCALGCLGVRPYRLLRCVSSWSGGEPGRGTKTVERVELGSRRAGPEGVVVPPLVTMAGSFSRSLRGVVPEGVVMVEELDGRYTDGDLCGFGRLTDGQEEFYEITQDGRDGGKPDVPVFRLTVAAPPVRTENGIDWTMRLRMQEPSAPFANEQLAEDGGTP